MVELNHGLPSQLAEAPFHAIAAGLASASRSAAARIGACWPKLLADPRQRRPLPRDRAEFLASRRSSRSRHGPTSGCGWILRSYSNDVASDRRVVRAVSRAMRRSRPIRLIVLRGRQIAHTAA
jgi:hypothetical protein